MIFQLSLLCVGEKRIWLDRRGDKVVCRDGALTLKRASWLTLTETLGLGEGTRVSIVSPFGETGELVALSRHANPDAHLIVISELKKRRSKRRLIESGILREDILDLPLEGRSCLVEVSLEGTARYLRRRSMASAIVLSDGGEIHLQLNGCAYSLDSAAGSISLRRVVSLVREEPLLRAA